MAPIAAPPAHDDPVPAIADVSNVSAASVPSTPADSRPDRPRVRRLVVFTGRLP
jgi:hypothetical protein